MCAVLGVHLVTERCELSKITFLMTYDRYMTHRKSICLDKIWLSGFLDPLSDVCLVLLRDTELPGILLRRAYKEITKRGGKLGKEVCGCHWEESMNQWETEEGTHSRHVHRRHHVMLTLSAGDRVFPFNSMGLSPDAMPALTHPFAAPTTLWSICCAPTQSEPEISRFSPSSR